LISVATFFFQGKFRPFLFDAELLAQPAVTLSLQQLLVSIGVHHQVRTPPVKELLDHENLSNTLYVMPVRLFLSVLVRYIIALAEDTNGLNAIYPDGNTNNSIEGMQIIEKFTKKACTQIFLPFTNIV
jgi:hypothetical protein